MKEYLYKELYELESRHWWFVAKKRIVLSMLGRYILKNEKNRILDAGCGSGLILNDLKQFGQVYGMDYSEEAIKFSKMIFDGEVKRGWMPGNIPFPPKHFEAILALDVLEHIDDDIESLRDIKKHLSDNGICLITVPAYMFLWSSHDVVHEHKRRYTVKDLKAKLNAAGFKTLKISYYNSLLFVPIYLTRMLKKVMNNKSSSDAVMPGKYVNTVLKSIFSLERYILRIMSIDFGVSIIAVVKNG